MAQACDRAGFFYVAVCDHVCVPRSHAAAMSTIWYDTVATLGFLAAATQRVRLLSYVYVAPYRHPLLTAKAFATLDALSGGRVILGVGAGHLEAEFATLGVDFTRRGALLDEAIDAGRDGVPRRVPGARRAALARCTTSGIRPRPVQQPRPPIWVGGTTPAALRRAAERGDGWLPQGTFRRPAAARRSPLIREHRRRMRGDAPIEIGTNSEWLYVGTPGFDLGPNTRTGSGDEIAASLRELHALGVHPLRRPLPHALVRRAGRPDRRLRRRGAPHLPRLSDAARRSHRHRLRHRPRHRREIALACAREGADVVLAARSAAKLEEVAAAVRASGRRALVRADRRRPGPRTAERLVDAARAEFGRIDVLVNNAFLSNPVVAGRDRPTSTTGGRSSR